MTMTLMKQAKTRLESSGAGLLLVAPALVIVIVFQVIPILFTLRLSVAEGPGFTLQGFVGLEHYAHLFSDIRFVNPARFPPTGALLNTLNWIVFAVPAVLLIGLLAALAADRSRYEALIRGAFFLPMVISGTVIGIIWLFVYSPNPNIGLLNGLTNGRTAWLGNPNTVNPALMAAWVWGQTGLSVVIIAAAIKGVPVELIESARVDGANGRRIFWHITLPLIRQPLSFLLVTQLVQVVKVFDVVFVMTGGGPAGMSRSLALYFYEQTFVSLDPQYGAAIVVVMSVLIVTVFRLARRTSGEDFSV